MQSKQFLRFTVLIRAEGDRDKSFLDYLYSLYHVKGIRVKIENEHGGTPKSLVETMIRVDLSKKFDKNVAFFDTDQGEEEVAEAEKLATSQNIIILKSITSIEVELAPFLTEDKKSLSKTKRSTNDAKEVLRKLCHLQNVDDEIDWHKYFPKTLLNQKRKSSPWLNRLICLIEEK